MTDRKDPVGKSSLEPTTDSTPTTPPPELSRRFFLGGMATLGVGATASLAACATPGGTTPMDSAALDRALQKNVKTVVVIYAENRSFNNLFADFPGLEKPLSALKPADYQQRDRDGSLLATLPPTWGGVNQVDSQAVEGVTYASGTQYQTNLPNAPHVLKGPQGELLPLGLVTRDLVHAFFRNQMQINGGKNDGFVAWGDAGGLTMGYYGDTAYHLRLWDVAREFVLCDNFFQGVFGGSFLNHQYLACGTVPFYPDLTTSPARLQVAKLASDDPTDFRLQPLETSPASAMAGPPKYGPYLLTPDGYAVNTMAPPYWPSWSRDAARPDYADAWQATLDAYKDSQGIPKIPNFQYHHQPFNYFKNLGPEFPVARKKRLRDGGLGDESRSNHFLADAEAGRLPAVTFYKPQGNLNMHAGYADIASGDRHIAHAIKLLRASPQWNNMVLIVTVDENGGWWDHVAPPQGDRWGPGTRIPALVVSPFARKGTVDHTIYDTGSILRLITRVFGLEKLDGLQQRDDAMRARGQPPMGDLTNALQFTG